MNSKKTAQAVPMNHTTTTTATATATVASPQATSTITALQQLDAMAFDWALGCPSLDGTTNSFVLTDLLSLTNPTTTTSATTASAANNTSSKKKQHQQQNAPSMPNGSVTCTPTLAKDDLDWMRLLDPTPTDSPRNNAPPNFADGWTASSGLGDCSPMGMQAQAMDHHANMMASTYQPVNLLPASQQQPSKLSPLAAFASLTDAASASLAASATTATTGIRPQQRFAHQRTDGKDNNDEDLPSAKRVKRDCTSQATLPPPPLATFSAPASPPSTTAAAATSLDEEHSTISPTTSVATSCLSSNATSPIPAPIPATMSMASTASSTATTTSSSRRRRRLTKVQLKQELQEANERNALLKSTIKDVRGEINSVLSVMLDLWKQGDLF